MSFFAAIKKIVGINNVYDNHTTKDHFNVSLVRIQYLYLVLQKDRFTDQHCNRAIVLGLFQTLRASLMILTITSLLWALPKVESSRCSFGLPSLLFFLLFPVKKPF